MLSALCWFLSLPEDGGDTLLQYTESLSPLRVIYPRRQNFKILLEDLGEEGKITLRCILYYGEMGGSSTALCFSISIVEANGSAIIVTFS
jgi:hypothetical protein